jgi:hypothetical protein
MCGARGASCSLFRLLASQYAEKAGKKFIRIAAHLFMSFFILNLIPSERACSSPTVLALVMYRIAIFYCALAPQVGQGRSFSMK